MIFTSFFCWILLITCVSSEQTSNIPSDATKADIKESNPTIVPAAKLKPATYQKWAHYHWVWLKNADGNQDNITELVYQYIENGIAVGAVNIDSEWATAFNNFEVDKNKFPDFKGFVNNLHKNLYIKIVMWVTSFVNVDNPDYNMCVENDYLIRDSRGQVYPMSWWHGSGALLDYSNPNARNWWHSQMDKVLNIDGSGVGIDGFKCDGSDPYILEYSLTGGALGYNNKTISYREYADAYYRDFFYHTRRVASARNDEHYNNAGLIMSRPVDCEVSQLSKACLSFSPKDVMYSGWVGDDDPTWNGLRGCARKVIFSAWSNYLNFGCDIGGYRGNEDTKDKELFIRWAQLNAFLPLMENGGGGEHRPWMYDQETVNIYRKYVKEHHKLALYLLSIGSFAMDAKKSVIIPVDNDDEKFQNDTDKSTTTTNDEINIGNKIKYRQPYTYSYMLGPNIIVHPVMYNASEGRDGNAYVSMVFPDDEPAFWLDWWEPYNINYVKEAGTRQRIPVSLQSYAVYVRQNSLMPIEENIDGANNVVSKTIFTWFGPVPNDSAQFNMRDASSNGIIARGFFNDKTSMTCELSAFDDVDSRLGRIGFNIIGAKEPKNVLIESSEDSNCSSEYRQHSKTIAVLCENIRQGLRINIEGFQSTLDASKDQE